MNHGEQLVKYHFTRSEQLVKVGKNNKVSLGNNHGEQLVKHHFTRSEQLAKVGKNNKVSLGNNSEFHIWVFSEMRGPG